MKSKRKVLLALTINKHYFIRGVVRYAREHDWYLVTDMMYTGRVPLGWRGDGILTILGYRRELADFIKSAGVPHGGHHAPNRIHAPQPLVPRLPKNHRNQPEDLPQETGNKDSDTRLRTRGWKESEHVGRSAACVGKAIL